MSANIEACPAEIEATPESPTNEGDRISPALLPVPTSP
jgi:hypothetical protein